MRRVLTLALAVAAIGSSTVLAQEASTTAASSTSSTSSVKGPGRNQRVLCGCATSRFLARGAVDVGEGTLGAWLHGETQIDGFAQVDGTGPVSATSLPFQVMPDERGANGASRFVTVRATDKGEGLLGVVRTGDKAPRDVLRATFSPGGTTSKAAPSLAALWLEPVEVRDRRDCGQYVTQRLAWEPAVGSAAVEGFAVKNLDSGVTTLVDARHVGAFGIGHVGVCDHGVDVTNAPARLEIQPLSSLGVAGDPWGFSHDGTGTTPTARLSSPASADQARIAMPFPVPGEPTRPMSWLSVGGLWILGPLFGALCALVAFVFWRLKRRRLVEARCASCGGAVPIDLLDEKTDGFFCPHCGAAGYWKGRGVDVDSTRLG